MCRCLRNLEERITSPGEGGTGSFELPDVSAGNRIWISWNPLEGQQTFLTTDLSLQPVFFKKVCMWGGQKLTVGVVLKHFAFTEAVSVEIGAHQFQLVPGRLASAI